MPSCSDYDLSSSNRNDPSGFEAKELDVEAPNSSFHEIELLN